MITVTLHEAKAKLNALVEAACLGEDIVLLKGSQIVARIAPLTAAEVEIAPHLTDAQAERFWKQIEAEPGTTFSGPAQAVSFLKKKTPCR